MPAARQLVCEPKWKVYVDLAGLRLFPWRALPSRSHLLTRACSNLISRQTPRDGISGLLQGFLPAAFHLVGCLCNLERIAPL